MTAITGHAASCTIRSISCKALAVPSCTITKATSGRSAAVMRATSGREVSGDDVVAQSGHRASDLVESDPWPIGDQDPQANNVFGVHRASIERSDP